MRRKDRERDTSYAMEILRDSEYAALATVNLDGTPYCIPISFVLFKNAIYFHCAPEGQKLTNIDNNNSVCLSCVRHTKILPETFTTEYESAVVTGNCYNVSDDDDKIKILTALCEKYAKSNIDHANAMIKELLDRTSVYKISIDKITAKANV